MILVCSIVVGAAPRSRNKGFLSVRGSDSSKKSATLKRVGDVGWYDRFEGYFVYIWAVGVGVATRLIHGANIHFECFTEAC